MAYLPELPEWTTGVYQLEKNDPVRGGVDGPANRPLIDLLKRTAWLKQRYEEAFSGLGWAELGEWAVGLEVTTPSQIVHYQGYWYRYGGSLPHTITGASPSLDDNDNWFNLGNDVSLRSNLGSSEEGLGGSLVALKQGGNLQQAITYVNPRMFGGISNSPDTDNTDAVLNAIAVAELPGFGLELMGGPWRVTKTVDLTNVRNIHADWTGRLLVNPSNFTAKHNQKYVMTFGSPDTDYTANRCVYSCVKGYLYVVSDNRNTELNGIYFKGQLLDCDAIRVVNLNGYGFRCDAVWDSVFKSVSVELCGNVSKHAFYVGPGGDTSNCLFFGRVQVERAYHKQIYLNVIRSNINTIHAERAKIITTDDGTTGLPSALTYENSYFLLSNSVISQMIIDAASDATIPTVTNIMSVRFNLHTSKISSVHLGGGSATTTYGQDSTIECSRILKYYNSSYPIVIADCFFGNSTGDGILMLGGEGGLVLGCQIDTFQPDYGTKQLVIDTCRINKDYDNTRTSVSGLSFRNTVFRAGFKGTHPDAPTSPTLLRDCRVDGVFSGGYQNAVIVNGGYLANVGLLSRAYAEFNDVRGGVFNYSGDRAFITKNCKFTTVTAWGAPSQGIHRIGQRTERIGAMVSGDAISYINKTDGAAGFVALQTLP
ncbi:hypothetical protein TUM17569_06880 [Klebsiella oxytoca]|nr:hypothetical protein TUM17569_06880 [Klebsiella oxytoca]